MDLFSLTAKFIHTIEAVCLTIGMSISGLFGHSQSTSVIMPSSEVVVPIAASSSAVIPASPLGDTQAPRKPVNIPKSAPTTTPVTVVTHPAEPSKSVEVPRGTVGSTTLAIQRIPLLSGGVARAGQSVAISYLQITNVGKEGALLKGFWVKQNGSASGKSVIGLSTVDDTGGSRGSVGGTEGTILFQDGLAFAPTDAFFAPGQTRLFTIKATLTQSALTYIDTQLQVVVSSIDTTATVQGKFPIQGTTWTIGE